MHPLSISALPECWPGVRRSLKASLPVLGAAEEKFVATAEQGSLSFTTWAEGRVTCRQDLHRLVRTAKMAGKIQQTLLQDPALAKKVWAQKITLGIQLFFILATVGLSYYLRTEGGNSLTKGLLAGAIVGNIVALPCLYAATAYHIHHRYSPLGDKKGEFFQELNLDASLAAFSQTKKN